MWRNVVKKELSNVHIMSTTFHLIEIGLRISYDKAKYLLVYRGFEVRLL